MLQWLKNTAKYIFCQIIYFTKLLDLYMRLVFLRKKQYAPAILVFHSFVKSLKDSINPEPAVYLPIDDLKKIILFLNKYFYVAPLDEVVEKLKDGQKFTKPTVAITVDDGFKDNYDYLYPLLKEFNMPATIFLTAGHINTKKMAWVERLMDTITKVKKEELSVECLGNGKIYPLQTLRDKRISFEKILQFLIGQDIKKRIECLNMIEQQLDYSPESGDFWLTWDQVREMEKHRITFGAHTLSHPILSKMPLEDAKKEIAESKKLIEEKLVHPIKHFAFPNGSAQDFTKELGLYCQQIGFESVSSTEWGINNAPADVWFLQRICPCLPVSVFFTVFVRTIATKRKSNKKPC